jgi:beta-N-acetylhexosaminidase
MPSGRASSHSKHGRRRAKAPRSRRRMIIVATATLVCASTALAVACTTRSSGAGAGASSRSTTPVTSPSPNTPTGTPVAPSTSAAPTTAAPTTPQLTALQLAGERVIFSYAGLTPPADLLTLIREGEVAGVIFFGDNISSESQIGAVVTELRQAQAASPVHLPLLLMTDQEGGIVQRLPGAPGISEKQVGQSSDPQSQATQAGTGAAQNLSGVGMNVNLAPVLDVYYSAGNFIDQSQRSYSSDPSVVASLGSAFITAQQKDGVAATAKHFPGLGSAPEGSNTDTGSVTLTVSLSELRDKDEVPYKSAISSGVKLIMLSWAIYPALDSAHPAGLSSVIVQELRNRLGFTGVTITDALEADALNPFGTTAQRADAAAGAGMDLILCSSGSVSQGEQAENALASALTSGQLSQSGFVAAANRVNALRSGLH